MMATIKYTVLGLVRTGGIMVWSLGFPLVMLTVFAAMFGPLDEMGELEAVRVAVVEPAPGVEGDAFREFVDELAGEEEPFLAPTWFATEGQALEALSQAAATDEPLAAVVRLDDDGPSIELANASSSSGMAELDASLLVMLMDGYASRSALVSGLVKDDPASLADPALLASVSEAADATERVDVTRNQPRESARYYFALLGMAALFGGTVSLVALQRMRPNVSALGARRTVGALSHGRTVLATLLACWIVEFACLALVFAYLRAGVGIDFGDRDGQCLAVLAVSSLTALALGCAVSAIPRVPEDGKSGIMTGIVCFASLFAGLYGQPTMQLADLVSAACPPLEWVNPAAQIAQAFYSVMYYDSVLPLLVHLLALALIAVVLFALAVGSLRRQRYEGL